FKRWNIMGVRHAVVHQRSRHQLTVLIVDRAFQKGLPNSLRDAAVHLAFHDHRIDYGAEVIDCGPVDNFGSASVAVYFDFTDVTASRESEVGRIVEARLLKSWLELLAGKFVRDVGIQRHIAPSR